MADQAELRASIAQAECRRVAQTCDLPIVTMPTLPEGFGPDLTWTTHVDALLENPFRPDRAAAGADAA
jgi:hypothetical protein